MTAAPTVTVCMPAFDREEYISESIASVTGQTFDDFELLVIDDGSSDRTAEIAESTGDSRVRVVRNERNLGVCRSRNRGIELARGEFVANLDSDDLAHPRRLEKQVAYLRAHPDCALLGSWAVRINARGRTKGIYRRPVSDRRIRAALLFRNCFKNTTVTARRSVLEKFRYREEFRVDEDVDLHVRIALEHEVANLGEPLCSYRRHRASLSRTEREATRAAEAKITAGQLERAGVVFDAEMLALHMRLRTQRSAAFTSAELDDVEEWLGRLAEANRRSGLYPEPEFSRNLGAKWWQASRRSECGSAGSVVRWSRSPLAPLSRGALLAAARDRALGRRD